jgi:hypothetical protein
MTVCHTMMLPLTINPCFRVMPVQVDHCSVLQHSWGTSAERNFFTHYMKRDRRLSWLLTVKCRAHAEPD